MDGHVGMSMLYDAITSDARSNPLFGGGEIAARSDSSFAGASSLQEPSSEAVDEYHGTLESGAQVNRCRVCNKTYERADHLSRHLKSHENARPFQCSQCSKRFNRPDLLTRHVATHERLKNNLDSRPMIKRTDRVTAACMACAAAKVKCRDDKPCARCRRKGLICQSSPAAARRHATFGARAEIADTAMSQDNNASALSHEHVTAHSYRELQPDIVFNTSNTNVRASFSPVATDGLDPTFGQRPNNLRFEDEPSRGNDSTAQYPTSMPIDSGQLMHDYQSMNDIMFYPPTSGFNQDLDFQFWDFPFDGEQFVNSTADFITNVEHEAQSSTSKSKIVQDTARGYAAFQRSPWLWTPTKNDHLFNDQGDLALNEDALTPNLTPSSVTDSRSFGPVPFLDTVSRDRMLALAVSTNKAAKPVPGFPSLEILNHLLQMYFVREAFQDDNWIHASTFKPADASPQLILALVSAGSTLISVPAIWKMGLALQEVVRYTVGEAWEFNNSATRDVQLSQAFLLCIDIGLWSGFRRKMEIAESFAQPIVTILRKTGVFQAPHETNSLVPTVNDSDDLTEAKWKMWVKRESYKRLAIHLFLHTTRSSISYQSSPLMLLPELTFDLPESRDLWVAKSASEWKARYLQKSFQQPVAENPTMVDLLHNINILDILQDQVDVDLCCILLLYGFWGQVWSFGESSKFYSRAGNASKRLWLTAQQSELCRDIETFTMQLSKLRRQPPEVQMVKETLLMILHSSPDELQKFAGKGGEEEASRSFTSLQSWVQTADARKAVWHAGQIFQIARNFPPAELRGFYTIVVYLASLTIWVYAQVSHLGTNGLNSTSSQAQGQGDQSSQVILDGPETRETRTFLSVGHGLPGLTQPTPDNEFNFASLENPTVVFNIARQIYRSNYPILSESLPPLVENLGNLMRDLGSRSPSRFSRGASEAESDM